MEFPVEIKCWMGPIPFTLTDAGGRDIGCADSESGFPQRMTVYADATRTTPIYKLSSGNVNSFSVEWRFANPQGAELGSVKRFGGRSVWRAYYEVQVGETSTFTVQEANPFVKIANFMVGGVPFMQLFSGAILNPTYRLTRRSGAPALRLRKTGPGPEVTWHPGRIFTIEQDGDLSESEQEVALLALMIVAKNEGSRG